MKILLSVIAIVVAFIMISAPSAFAQTGAPLSKHPQDKGFAFHTKEFTSGYIIGWALK